MGLPLRFAIKTEPIIKKLSTSFIQSNPRVSSRQSLIRYDNYFWLFCHSRESGPDRGHPFRDGNPEFAGFRLSLRSAGMTQDFKCHKTYALSLSFFWVICSLLIKPISAAQQKRLPALLFSLDLARMGLPCSGFFWDC